jgi:hypothetical protein
METSTSPPIRTCSTPSACPKANTACSSNTGNEADKHDYCTQFGVDSDEDIARTLAMFGGFTEGLQLFASFAMLMNFPRFNKMKGMGQIVTWSCATKACTAKASPACSTPL